MSAKKVDIIIDGRHQQVSPGMAKMFVRLANLDWADEWILLRKLEDLINHGPGR
jgi:hypothetical protein